VTGERYFVALAAYIHRNPQKHGFVADFRDWPYSSYHTLATTQPTRLRRDDVITWFGGADSFIAAHIGDTLTFDARQAIGDDDENDG
jgi:putative transposase